MIWLAVALAGGAGAALRFLVDQQLSGQPTRLFPWGTFVINVSGSFAAGVIGGLAATAALSDDLHTVVAGGFLGAYTTFSTAMYETVRLLEEGAGPMALVNLLAPLLLSVAVALLGWWLVI